MAVDRFGLDGGSLVVELASNDGYLLQHVVERGIPALGIEPAANVAEVAREKGIETIVEFFGPGPGPSRSRPRVASRTCWPPTTSWPTCPTSTTSSAGISIVLAPDGVATIEVPHLLRLVESNQFDTIYHEHFSLLLAADRAQGLRRARTRALRRRRAASPTAVRCATTSSAPAPDARR